jgi:Protein of unknown function (DUF3102)
MTDALTTNPILDKHATKIRQLGKRVVANVIEIGRRLVDCRDNHLKHGEWLPWIKKEFGWTDRTARNFINVYEQSKSEKFSNLPDLPVSSLYLLAAPSTSKAARDEIADRAKGGEVIKLADVKATIKNKKAGGGKGKAGAAKGNAAEPEANALVWKREGGGTGAKTSSGSYWVDKIGVDLYATQFWPKGGGRVSLGNCTSLKAAKAVVQTHYATKQETGTEGAAPSGSLERLLAEARQHVTTDPATTGATAATAAKPEANALVWGNDDPKVLYASTSRGQYWIRKRAKGYPVTFLYHRKPRHGDRNPTIGTGFASLDAAKAAAQTHYDKSTAKPLGKREQKRLAKERHREVMRGKGETLAKAVIAKNREMARLVCDIMDDLYSRDAFEETLLNEFGIISRDDNGKFIASDDDTGKVLGQFDSWIEASHAIDAAKDAKGTS